MTKAQALQLMNALEQNKINADARMQFDAQGAETWQVTLDPALTYTGAQLAQLTTYCAQNGLVLSVIVAQMGVT